MLPHNYKNHLQSRWTQTEGDEEKVYMNDVWMISFRPHWNAGTFRDGCLRFWAPSPHGHRNTGPYTYRSPSHWSFCRALSYTWSWSGPLNAGIHKHLPYDTHFWGSTDRPPLATVGRIIPSTISGRCWWGVGPCLIGTQLGPNWVRFMPPLAMCFSSLLLWTSNTKMRKRVGLNRQHIIIENDWSKMDMGNGNNIEHMYHFLSNILWLYAVLMSIRWSTL